MKLSQIPTEHNISKEDFVKRYVKPQKPVIIRNFTEHWPAYSKWSLDYMKEVAGDHTVPLYDDRPVTHENKFNEPHAKLKLSEYVDLLKREPTKFRIFLWNILKEVPSLQKDFVFPKFGINLLKGLPMLFFGGTSSYTFIHYDIDLANIMHFHFEGSKRVTLFDQKQNKYLYKVPFSLLAREDINFSNPDLEKWPALKHVEGFEGNLEHGDMLYMPEGYWHYMEYITPGFSMSLRGIPRNPKNLLKALYNILIMRSLDNCMRKLRGQKWIDWKNRQAIIRTNKNLRKLTQTWTTIISL